MRCLAVGVILLCAMVGCSPTAPKTRADVSSPPATVDLSPQGMKKAESSTASSADPGKGQPEKEATEGS